MNLKYYKDRRGNWRWTLTSRGKIVGASTEGYATKARAIANFESLVTKGPQAKVEVVEPAAKKVVKKVAKKVAKKVVRKRAAKPVPVTSDDGF